MFVTVVTYVHVEFFFFFQAEDGIRDPLVTGVQTCALPILAPSSSTRTELPARAARPPKAPGASTRTRSNSRTSVHSRRRCREFMTRWPLGRSEERRVGKECRCRRVAEQ